MKDLVKRYVQHDDVVGMIIWEYSHLLLFIDFEIEENLVNETLIWLPD